MVSKIILYTGPVNCGKTTKLKKFTRDQKTKGTQVAGLLSLKNYNPNGTIIGYNLMNIKNETICENGIKRKIPPGKKPEFYITEPGLDFGKNALKLQSVQNAQIIIVDEFGPLELKGLGWRKSIENIIDRTDSLLILSLRKKILKNTQNLLLTRKLKFETISPDNPLPSPPLPT